MPELRFSPTAQLPETHAARGAQAVGHAREGGDEGFEGPWYAYPAMSNAGAAALILAVAWGLKRLQSPSWLSALLYLAGILVGARYWAREGWEVLRKERVIGIEALMGFAALGAVLLGQWEEAGLLAVIYATAEALEEYTYARTRTAIRALLNLAPPTAHRLAGGQEEVVAAADLTPGDLIVIRPGERVPTDAVILKGRSSLDESAVTGESMPVDKGPGSKLFAGTINTTGALAARVIADYESNTLSRMIHLVQEAQEVKSHSQRWIDRFGRRYSPGVLAAAAFLLVVCPLFDGHVATWAHRAVVLLVAAAPCALVMSTPVATAAAIARAGREGVLIKGGVHLERLNRIRVVAFDKTGTLTQGRARVTDVIPLGGATEREVLQLAAGVERWSEHPIARALLERASDSGLQVPDTTGFQALVGAGARALFKGEELLVGTAGLLEQHGVCLESGLNGQIERLEREGKTVIVVG
ncbi:MAG: heavy metal translocating P-type ATPase, partial [Bacillota bacterium]